MPWEQTRLVLFPWIYLEVRSYWFIEFECHYVQELLQGEEEVTAASRRKGLKGRKMGVQDVVKEMTKGGVVQTGAINPSVGKCENENTGGKGGKLNIECELRVSSRSPPSSVKLVGLIPFSSDYHAPKTHPPKNN